jgi:hypothetical protein
MKLLLVVVVVALATFQSANSLKCYTCKVEEEGACQDTEETLQECVEAESAAVNCFAVELSKLFKTYDVQQYQSIG